MKVKAYVYVIVGGVTKLLRPGDTVPDGVVVKNRDAVEADAKILPAPAPEPKKDEDPAPAPAPAPRKRTAAKETPKETE